MWNTFWADVVVAVIGAVLTSGLAVWIALLTVKRELARRERDGVEQLIHEINSRRVLIDIHPKLVLKARKRRDYERCALSVRYLRDLARSTRRDTRGNRNASDALGGLVSAFNRYLEDSELDPTRYQFHLMMARSAAISCGAEIQATLPSVPAIKPGSEAL